MTLRDEDPDVPSIGERCAMLAAHLEHDLVGADHEHVVGALLAAMRGLRELRGEYADDPSAFEASVGDVQRLRDQVHDALESSAPALVRELVRYDKAFDLLFECRREVELALAEIYGSREETELPFECGTLLIRRRRVPGRTPGRTRRTCRFFVRWRRSGPPVVEQPADAACQLVDAEGLAEQEHRRVGLHGGEGIGTRVPGHDERGEAGAGLAESRDQLDAVEPRHDDVGDDDVDRDGGALQDR